MENTNVALCYYYVKLMNLAVEYWQLLALHLSDYLNDDNGEKSGVHVNGVNYDDGDLDYVDDYDVKMVKEEMI